MPVRPTPAPTLRALRAPAAFYEVLRPFFKGSLSGGQVQGITAKLVAFGDAGAPLAWTAYGLGTSWWETARTMQPVREGTRGAGCAYGRPGCHAGQVAYGRGDVQLTWDRNYERADAELQLKGALIASYDLALRPDISARIMVRGMTEGWFTGRRFADYLPSSGPAPIGALSRARAIINGRDHALDVAEAADTFQEALTAGGWA